MAVFREHSIKTLLSELKNWFSLKAKTVFSVNGHLPVDGRVTFDTIPLADNLTTTDTQQSSGTFIIRASGGADSLADGKSYVSRLMGNSVHEGYVEEQLDMRVIPMPRTEANPITATIDRAVFVARVPDSATITLVYTTTWSDDPTLYGISITGEPVAGDQIVITYVKGDRGTITVATPTAIVSTGWNLYNNITRYAYAPKYSETYGYRIGGTYTSIGFATTPTGSQTPITVSGGLFNIPSDGYIIVSGGDETTYIYPTWSDWTAGYPGSLETYSETSINLASVMASYFPNGLMSVGEVRDEINLNTGNAISRIERLEYSAENITSVSGRDYDADTNYIYVVRTAEIVNSISLPDQLTVSEHGTEFFRGTDIGVYAEILYGQNLKDILRRGVVKTINGRHPNPVTGDITVIEGGGSGSGSYGAYRLDATIPVSAWSSTRPYTATVTNEYIKATMDGSETWLDDESVMLGETTFTSQDGSLIIATTVKPTTEWNLHVSFALNGADVLAETEENTRSIRKILPVITGTTNNSDYTIKVGDYFEADGNLYKATAAIAQNSAWGSSATQQSDTALNTLNSNIASMVKSVHVLWGNKLNIPFKSNVGGFHALLMINNTDVYVLWNSSASTSYTQVLGTTAITIERNDTTVTVTTASNASISAFYIDN